MLKNKALPIILVVSFLLGAQPVRARDIDNFKNTIGASCFYDGETLPVTMSLDKSFLYNSDDAAEINSGENSAAGLAELKIAIDNASVGITGEAGEPGNISGGLIAKQFIINPVDEVDNIKVSGYLPQVEGLNRTAFTSILNEKIRKSYTSLVNAGYRSIDTDYEVYNWANMTSIVVRYNIGGEKAANKKQAVRTFVFDDISQSEVTLRNLLGKDYTAYINKYISGEITKAQTGIYYTGANKFSSIRSNQSFYIKDGVIYILFDEYTIAPASAGTTEFEIPLESISFTLSHGEYARENGIIYVPVTVAMRLGMAVELKSGGIMEITSHNGEKTVAINVNNDNLNPSEVMLINGYNIALSLDYLSSKLEISAHTKDNSDEIEIFYIF